MHIDREIDNVIHEVEELVINQGISGDIKYFSYHKERYRRMASTVVRKTAKGARVLDIGSHYLHSSMILKRLGYEVHGIDVSEFWDLDFVINRGETFGVKSIVQDDLQNLQAIELKENEYDLILFTEILEHITFNPINFWKKIYELLKEDGLIYISTPNSLSAQGMLRGMKDLITFKGIGNSLEMIFAKVTYGHHWKEYSYRELKKYHKMLNNDFTATVKFYSYQPFDKSSLVLLFWSVIRMLGNFMYVFSSDLEALVSIDKTKNSQWKLESPKY